MKHLKNISNTSKDTLKLRLKQREDFWITKLDILAPKGLTKEVNNAKFQLPKLFVHALIFRCSKKTRKKLTGDATITRGLYGV